MKTSKKLYAKYNKLKAEVIEAIQAKLTEDRFIFEDAFEDEANNNLEAVNKDEVFFNCDADKTGGDAYPLHALGIEDAFYILGVLETEGK
jgi:hypothetical protein